MSWPQRVRWTIAAGWLAVVLWVTLRSAPDQAARVAALPWYCVVCGDGGIADSLLNLLLFAPFGLLGRAMGLPRWPSLAFVVALTIAIETTQAKLLVGRDGSLGDVLANSGGAILAWLAYPVLARLGRPSRRLAWASAGGLLFLSAVIWLGTGAALRPALSPDGPWVGQLQHHWTANDDFPGRILSAAINGVDVPNDPLDRLPIQADSVDVRTAFTYTRPVPPRQASMLRIVDGRGRMQLSLIESGDDLIAELHLRASSWGFHTPQWMFRGVLRAPRHRRREIDVRWTRGSVGVSAADSGTGPEATRIRPLSIALGWIFIHPFVQVVSDSAGWWDCLWLAWWFGLLGWPAGALGWRAAAVMLSAQVAVIIAAGSAMATPWHPGELLVGIAAFLLAAALAHRRTRTGGRSVS